MFRFCHSERSRGISRNSLRKIIPHQRETSLDMTTRVSLAFLAAILASIAAAQESPTPTSPASPEQSPALSIPPERSTTSPAAPEQTPSVSPARSVRISLLRQPLDGAIRLVIYDNNGKIE